MHTALRVEDGKYIAGIGGSNKASNVYMSDGVTSVESAINATTANAKVSLGNVSTYTPTTNGVLKAGTSNNTSNAFIYIADTTANFVMAVCNGYNANTGCFCSAPVYSPILS